MVELGERMLLVAILGTVTVLGAFISITAAYHIKLGSVSKQLAVRTMPLPEPATRRAPASKLSQSATVAPPRCTRRTPGTPTNTIWYVAAYQAVTLAVYHPSKSLAVCHPSCLCRL